MLRASSEDTTGGKSFITPVSRAASTIRFIARPSNTTERPARAPASASVLTRATLEAKVVATTIPCAPLTSFSISGPSVASERPGIAENTLVLSQINAFTPSLQTSAHKAGSNASPTPGVRSILKSPEWITRPSGVSITKEEDSGMECEIGRKPTVKGPTVICSGQGPAVVTASFGWPCSFIFRRAMFAVNLRA